MVYSVFRVIFTLRSAVPPLARELRAVQTKETTLTGAQDCTSFDSNCMNDVGFIDVLSLPLTGMLSLLFIPAYFSFLASLNGVVNLTYRGVGMGFEEPHLRLMSWLVGSGFPCLSHFSAYIFGSSEWASVMVLL